MRSTGLTGQLERNDMNRFILDNTPDGISQAMCDKHVVKMILEYAQLLSTAHHEIDGEQVGYKPTHKNHPCAKWVRESNNNYNWLYCLFAALSDEYTHRYGKVHLTWKKLSETLREPPKGIPIGHLTPLPQCMPEEYHHESTLTAYRTYYKEGKANLLSWTKREVPQWTLQR